MRRRCLVLVTSLVALLQAGTGLAANVAKPRRPAPADLAFVNGAVFTVDAARRWASAVQRRP